jgi:hypothetical protein
LNSVFINFSLSPTYLLIKSLDETEKNVALHSVAQAFAKKVFPVPGGPYNNIPFHGYIAPFIIIINLLNIHFNDNIIIYFENMRKFNWKNNCFL